MRENLDLMIEAAVVEGQLSSGVSPKVVAARSTLGTRGVAVLASKDGTPVKKRNPPWQPEEDKFLEDYLGVLSETEIGEALGRTPTAVHLRWDRDLRLPAPSKHPGILTCDQIASGLCIDGKSVARLIDRGILPGHRLPSERTIRIVSRVRVLMFLTNPMNFIYFKPQRVGSRIPQRGVGSYDRVFWAKARRLVRKRLSLWRDSWLTIGEAAQRLGVEHGIVNNDIHKRKIAAFQWGNWNLLASTVASAARSFKGRSGKGRKGEERLVLSPRAEAFLVLAKAIGVFDVDIAALMGWNMARIPYVMHRLRQKGRIRKIIRDSGLRILQDRQGEVFADWRKYRRRFPRLAALMGRLRNASRMNRLERKYFDKVNRKARRYAELRARQRKSTGQRVLNRKAA
jgi:hypothetical protein